MVRLELAEMLPVFSVTFEFITLIALTSLSVLSQRKFSAITCRLSQEDTKPDICFDASKLRAMDLQLWISR